MIKLQSAQNCSSKLPLKIFIAFPFCSRTVPASLNPLIPGVLPKHPHPAPFPTKGGSWLLCSLRMLWSSVCLPRGLEKPPPTVTGQRGWPQVASQRPVPKSCPGICRPSSTNPPLQNDGCSGSSAHFVTAPPSFPKLHSIKANSPCSLPTRF